MEDRDFRAAALEQLGELLLEVPITTDIIVTLESHALRMDSLDDETIKNARLHRKVATAGQAEGSFEVTASCGDMKVIAKVVVKGVNTHWIGEVPHQR